MISFFKTMFHSKFTISYVFIPSSIKIDKKISLIFLCENVAREHTLIHKKCQVIDISEKGMGVNSPLHNFGLYGTLPTF